jgi:acetyltransferase EpsM
MILIGASGFGREVLWVCRRAGLEVTGFCDDAPDKQAGDFCGLPLLGGIEPAAARLGADARCHIAVGDNRSRQRLAARARAAGWTPVAVVDPAALVAPDAEIGAGAFVGPHAVLSCAARIGVCALVNQHATIGHDAVVGDFAQVCPGARLSGQGALAEGALMGSNAVLLPGRKMGQWSVLGAGAVGLQDLPAHACIARVR